MGLKIFSIISPLPVLLKVRQHCNHSNQPSIQDVHTCTGTLETRFLIDKCFITALSYVEKYFKWLMSFALENPFHSIIYVSIYHLLSQDDLEEFSSEKTLLIYISKKKQQHKFQST